MSKHTTPELTVRRLIHSLGFRYRLHVPTLPGKPDLVFPRLKKIVNIHGCFWHMHACGACRIPHTRRKYWLAKLQRNAERDQRTTRALRARGWKVLTVWECKTRNLQQIKARLKAFLSHA